MGVGGGKISAVPVCGLGLVHTFTGIFESANFSLRIQKCSRPHIAYIKIKSNLLIQMYPGIHSSVINQALI